MARREKAILPEYMHSRATRADVARVAGVAESTVSRALRESPLISAEVKDRVRRAAAALGYIPSRQAARFATNRTYHLGFVVRSYRAFPPFSRAYFPAVLDGALLGAEQRGYYITIILDRHHESADDIIRLVHAREVDGLLLTATPREDPRVEYLKKSGVPFVLINSYARGVSSVDGNAEPGMRKAFEHITSYGHRRVGYITGDMAFRNAADRLEVFRNLCREFGCESMIVEGDFSRTSGYKCAGHLLRSDNPPTVIMTAADREAIGVLDYCREHGIRVPGEVSLVGYDNLDPAKDVTPRLTTVHNPVTETAALAAELLIDMIEGRVKRPVARWLDTGFVARESTGPCAGKP